jgi:Cof subfamily protein (haloacid dehalogenase superfamily)
MATRLVIADVDGTLLTRNKAVTLHTIQAVERLHAAGVHFTITSGRPPRGLASLVAQLKLTAPLAAFNGAVFVEADLETVIARHTIPREVARRAVDYLLEQGLDVWVYQGFDWFVRDPAGIHVDRERHNVGFDPVVIADLHAVLDAPVKIVGVSLDHALVARCEAALQERLGAGATAVRSQPYYLDVTHPEANKGMVAREAARILRVPLSECATIGDMPNDIPMLAIAGIGIAMGNAGPEVQRIARHVTLSNDEDGFAHAVDNFILGEPPVASNELGLPLRTRACLFGLDGVLTQTSRLHAEAWKRLLDPYLRERARASGQPFVPFDPVRDYAAHFQGQASPGDIRAFLDSRGVELPAHVLRALAEDKAQLLADLLGQQHLDAYEGSVRYVQAARAVGLRTAVVCSNRHGQAALDAAGIADLFDEGRSGHFVYIVGIDRGGRGAELRRHGADVVVQDLGALLRQRG